MSTGQIYSRCNSRVMFVWDSFTLRVPRVDDIDSLMLNNVIWALQLTFEIVVCVVRTPPDGKRGILV